MFTVELLTCVLMDYSIRTCSRPGANYCPDGPPGGESAWVPRHCEADGALSGLFDQCYIAENICTY
jgi:hypothetical protein